MVNLIYFILTDESTRVKLPQKTSEPSSGYINANYISGFKCESNSYIAAQGPMSNTINDFWLMIWTECVSCVVMITKLIERNKYKCELYFPIEALVPAQYDDIFVTVNHVAYFEDYEIRQLTVMVIVKLLIMY